MLLFLLFIVSQCTLADTLCGRVYDHSDGCIQCGGDNDGCPDSNDQVKICGGYGDCDSNDDCAGDHLICGQNNCNDVVYGGLTEDTQERLRRPSSNWVSSAYCEFDQMDDCCMNRESCFHGDNVLLLASGDKLNLHQLSKEEKFEVMNQDGQTTFVTMDLWAMKQAIDVHKSSERLYMEICVEESCVTVTDNHAVAFRNAQNEHDFKIAQKVEEGDLIFMRDAEYMPVTHVESKMMNSSLYVPVNLQGYAYIMFGDMAVPIWGDYRGVRLQDQGALYDTWVEYFGKACYMDSLFGHCTALMEGDEMATIVRKIMDASMDYARRDNNVDSDSYETPNLFIQEAFPDLKWSFWFAENAIWLVIGGIFLSIGAASFKYFYHKK